jgi:hypothetical protein
MEPAIACLDRLFGFVGEILSNNLRIFDHKNPRKIKNLFLRKTRSAAKVIVPPNPRSTVLKTPNPAQPLKSDAPILVPRKLKDARRIPKTSIDAKPKLNIFFLPLESA